MVPCAVSEDSGGLRSILGYYRGPPDVRGSQKCFKGVPGFQGSQGRVIRSQENPGVLQEVSGDLRGVHGVSRAFQGVLGNSS